MPISSLKLSQTFSLNMTLRNLYLHISVKPYYHYWPRKSNLNAQIMFRSQLHYSEPADKVHLYMRYWCQLNLIFPTFKRKGLTLEPTDVASAWTSCTDWANTSFLKFICSSEKWRWTQFSIIQGILEIKWKCPM